MQRASQLGPSRHVPWCHPAPSPPCSQWIAEENRHGDVLGRYLYLSGRVDMKQGEGVRHRAAWLGGQGPLDEC